MQGFIRLHKLCSSLGQNIAKKHWSFENAVIPDPTICPLFLFPNSSWLKVDHEPVEDNLSSIIIIWNVIQDLPCSRKACKSVLTASTWAYHLVSDNLFTMGKWAPSSDNAVERRSHLQLEAEKKLCTGFWQVKRKSMLLDNIQQHIFQPNFLNVQNMECNLQTHLAL